MLGHVYVVEDAKDLAQIVRDVTRYGGAYRPEVCQGPPNVRVCINYKPKRIFMNSFNVGPTGRR